MCTLAMELQASEAISLPTEPSPLPTRNSSFSQQQNVWIQLAYELLTVILIPVGKVFLSPLGGKLPEDSCAIPSWVFPS